MPLRAASPSPRRAGSTRRSRKPSSSAPAEKAIARIASSCDSAWSTWAGGTAGTAEPADAVPASKAVPTSWASFGAVGVPDEHVVLGQRGERLAVQRVAAQLRGVIALAGVDRRVQRDGVAGDQHGALADGGDDVVVLAGELAVALVVARLRGRALLRDRGDRLGVVGRRKVRHELRLAACRPRASARARRRRPRRPSRAGCPGRTRTRSPRSPTWPRRSSPRSSGSPGTSRPGRAPSARQTTRGRRWRRRRTASRPGTRRLPCHRCRRRRALRRWWWRRRTQRRRGRGRTWQLPRMGGGRSCPHSTHEIARKS